MNIKLFLKKILQKILGLNNYLFVFSIFKIFTLKFDKNEKDFLKFLELLKEDDHVLDIGANIGIMTYLLSKKCKRGFIYSFEPIPENVFVLKRIINFFRLTNVKVF